MQNKATSFFTHSIDEAQCTITDKNDLSIELTKIIIENCTDYYLYVKSYAKQLKESSMNGRFAQRFEIGLQKIAASLGKKGLKRKSWGG